MQYHISVSDYATSSTELLGVLRGAAIFQVRPEDFSRNQAPDYAMVPLGKYSRVL